MQISPLQDSDILQEKDKVVYNLVSVLNSESFYLLDWLPDSGKGEEMDIYIHTK